MAEWMGWPFVGHTKSNGRDVEGSGRQCGRKFFTYYQLSRNKQGEKRKWLAEHNAITVTLDSVGGVGGEEQNGYANREAG